MSQSDAILAHLRSGQPLTPLDALERFGCFRLAARIAELRQAGHAVEVQKLRFGKKSVAQYRMAERAN